MKLSLLLLLLLFFFTPSSRAGDVRKPLEQPEEVRENLMGMLFKHVVIKTGHGPLFLLPLVDRNKDLGFSYGLMPIWAIRDSGGRKIKTVFAPSIHYNRYLKTILTFRGYHFPDEKKLWVGRAAYSAEVRKEIFLHYYDPEFLSTKYRLNAEFHLLQDGKPSFYGFGPNSALSDGANYSLFKIGEEFTWDIPIIGYWFLDLTHRYFQKEVRRGPIVTQPQLDDVLPGEFAGASSFKKFMTHGVAIVLDSTDHPALPRRGTYLNLSLLASNRHLVSDYTYQVYAVQFKHYLNFKNGRWITALNLHFEQQTGNSIPFYEMPVVGEYTGLRVVGDGRYVDKGKLVLRAEERIRISRSPFLRFFSEMEVTPFLDMGTVFSEPKRFRSRNLHAGWGAAFRLVIRPQIVGTIDIAFGREGPNHLIKVGYPF